MFAGLIATALAVAPAAVDLETDPDFVKMTERVVIAAEAYRMQRGLTEQQLAYCMTRLNIEMDQNPTLVGVEGLEKLSAQERAAEIWVRESYWKTAVITCLKALEHQDGAKARP